MEFPLFQNDLGISLELRNEATAAQGQDLIRDKKVIPLSEKQDESPDADCFSINLSDFSGRIIIRRKRRLRRASEKSVTLPEDCDDSKSGMSFMYGGGNRKSSDNFSNLGFDSSSSLEHNYKRSSSSESFDTTNNNTEESLYFGGGPDRGYSLKGTNVEDYTKRTDPQRKKLNPSSADEPTEVTTITFENEDSLTDKENTTHIRNSKRSSAEESRKQRAQGETTPFQSDKKPTIISNPKSTMKNAKARWKLLSKAVSERRIAPKLGARAALMGVQKDQFYDAPTKLHELCAKDDVSLRELEQELEKNPNAVSVKDSFGQLPLHILGDNDDLVSTPQGISVATAFAITLMAYHPDSITTISTHGFMPFVKLIFDWNRWVYKKHAKTSKKTEPKIIHAFKGATRLISEALTVNQNSSDTECAVVGTRQDAGSAAAASQQESESVVTGKSQNDDDSTTADVDSVSKNIESSTRKLEPSARNLDSLSSRKFPRVEMWGEVKWCFQMLSMAMDVLGGKIDEGTHLFRRKHGSNDGARTALVTHVVMKIPNFMKTLLLNDDEGGNRRKRIFKCSFMRRALLTPESVGRWVTSMLRKTGTPSARAIDYLAMVSEVTPKDYVGEYRSVSRDDVVIFRELREHIFEAIEALDGTVASLVVLEQKEVERAAATRVVWATMNKSLRRPFVVALLLVDFVLHLTLLFAFRNAVSVLIDLDSSLGAVPSQVVFLICSHYFIRKICETLALLSLSVAVVRSYLTNLWNIFEMAAIILTIMAIVWRQAKPDEYKQGLNSFVLGLLWLKVLNFLKVANKQMATFIIALFQILKDLRYFAVVMVTFIFMFADMLRIAISTSSDGKFCQQTEDEVYELEGPVADFCSPSPTTSLIRVYSIVIGDFELNNFKETDGMLILFIMLTMVGLVVMLNVIIAVISDSYDKAKIDATVLFGRARVNFVARNDALESFLSPAGSNPVKELKTMNTRSTFVALNRVLRWFVLISLIVTAFYALVYIVGRATVGIIDGMPILRLIFLFIFLIILAPALWVLILFALGGVVEETLPGRVRGTFQSVNRCTDHFVKFLANRILGTRDTTNSDACNDDGSSPEDDEWKGTMYYMEKSIEGTVQKGTEDVKTEMQEVEKRLLNRLDELLNEEGKTST